MISEAHGDIELKVQSASSIHAVRLEYVARNASPRAIFLFNILHDEIAENGVYPLLSGAYVEVEPDAVVVSRKLFPVPELMSVEHRNIPFVTRLMPGQSVHEIVDLPLPLKPLDPYRTNDPHDLTQWLELPLLFELGYFLGAPGTEQLGRSYHTDHGDRPGFDVFTESSQKLVRAGPLGKLPVVTTRDGQPAK